jgi:uncharacterized membrane protein HdeD (DUF308 family)
MWKTSLRITPIVLCALLAGAHFLHQGWAWGVAVSIASLGLLAIEQRWAGRVMQLLLIVMSLEWVRTMTVLVEQRQQTGQPWTKLVVILSAVAMFTVLCVAAVPIRGKVKSNDSE